MVVVSLLAANRDGARFADAASFDPERAEDTHLAFGHASTPAWAPRWPGSKAASRSLGCSRAARDCDWLSTGPAVVAARLVHARPGPPARSGRVTPHALPSLKKPENQHYVN